MAVATTTRTRPAIVYMAFLLFGALLSWSEAEEFPTTVFDDGAREAQVSAGPVVARVTLLDRPEADPDFESPVLTVAVDGRTVLEVVGVASGFDFPATEASIAEIDSANDSPEIYFASYSGGAHCCTQVIVASAVGDRWIAVPIGEFDGDGGFLTDLDGDGAAEIATLDNRFLYQFGCYACSAGPLVIKAVNRGEAIDVSTEPRFLAAHRAWLERLEDTIDPVDKWSSPGFLAGWVAAKVRVGEGDDAWAALNENWDLTSDEGEEVCMTDRDIEDCPKRHLKVLNFPDRLELFLRQTGYLG